MQSRFPFPDASYKTVSPLVAWALTSPPGGVGEEYIKVKVLGRGVTLSISQCLLVYRAV